MAACNWVRQTLLFSGAYPEGLVQISRRFLRDPQEVTQAAQPSAAKIRQRVYEVTEDHRLHAVGLLLNHWRLVRTLACPVNLELGDWIIDRALEPTGRCRRLRSTQGLRRRSSPEVDRSFAQKTATGSFGSGSGLRSALLNGRFNAPI